MRQPPDGRPEQRPPTATWSLVGRREAVAQAREHLREFLAACDRAATAATLRDGLLVVSELVSNAVVHAPGPCVLYLGYRDGVLSVGVRDTNPALPTPRVPDPAAADGGFGWHLLMSLTSRIHVRPHVDDGKTITAVLRADHMP